MPVGQDSVPWDPRDWVGRVSGEIKGWGFTWKVRQLTLLILQGSHVIAGVFPLILGEDNMWLGVLTPPTTMSPSGI